MMSEKKPIDLYPKTNINAYDGMPVTADVWSAAHTEHRSMMSAHNALQHKPGIVCGLEVKANEPADHFVFITPGVAVDELGRVIVVDQTIAYDFGEESTGTYLLLLGYSEHEVENPDTGLKMMQHDYIIAARPSLPKQPTVELARITIRQKGAKLRDAADPESPHSEELDLRYRLDDPRIERKIHVGMKNLGGNAERVNEGWDVMQQVFPRMTGDALIIDRDVDIDERIMGFDLFYISAFGKQDLSSEQLSVIKNYLAAGKGLILEGLDGEGWESMKRITVAYNCRIVDEVLSPLMKKPYFFRKLPKRVSLDNLLVDVNLILCGDSTASSWAGICGDEVLDREEIRSCLEWGVNLLTYCV